MNLCLHPVISSGVDSVLPGMNHGRVTGLKGPPLKEKLALAEHRVQWHRRTERFFSTSATRFHHIPWDNPLVLFGQTG